MSRRKNKIVDALGTINTITIYDEKYNWLLAESAERILELDNMWSVFKPHSEVSRLNEAAGKEYVPISPETMELLKRAKYFNEVSGGAFTITACPLTGLWRNAIREKKLPPKDKIDQAVQLVNDSDILLDSLNGYAMLRKAGQSIDLGAIAKGYVADEIRRILTGSGVENALLNFGGTVVVIGEPLNVGIQHPQKETGKPLGKLRCSGKAVVTSGNYERYFELEGKKYHHIINPWNGYPADNGFCGITLIGDSAMDMDALSTAFFVMELEKGIQMIQQHNAEAILVSHQMDVFCTAGLNDNFTLINDKNRIAANEAMKNN